MKLQDQVIRIEQAKGLQELGVTADSYFLYYEYKRNGATHCEFNYAPALTEVTNEYPAFTASDLSGLLPNHIAGDELGSLIIQHNITTKKHKQWYCHYWGLTKNVVEHVYGFSMVDCMANMLIHLLENKLITPEQVNISLTSQTTSI